MASKAAKKASYKWTTETTRALIHFRANNEQGFLKSKQAPKKLWEQFIQEAGLVGTIEPHQAAKKWENLKTRYKELKNPKTGSGTDGGEETAATWQYYQDMHEVLGGRPSIDPPLLVASFTPEEDPTSLLMEIVDGPSTSASATADSASSPSTASTSAVNPESSAMSAASPPTPSPRKKKRKSNPIVDFLKAESQREQSRHEESEAKTERFLTLFERMVDKM